jgi:hypothetical protein
MWQVRSGVSGIGHTVRGSHALSQARIPEPPGVAVQLVALSLVRHVWP